ncbi:hypothetical protein BpHYR1_018935 [Brachionus plicatilis]|uniref:Uncharacterized protein n=1 Tax=Brachionus plicatilis TaxID=10195 RepID=A0A3M7S6V7_BRAPC|nr:hypothetical protein BpHYR1_018935 [Brachionus plicatilis]
MNSLIRKKRYFFKYRFTGYKKKIQFISIVFEYGDLDGERIITIGDFHLNISKEYCLLKNWPQSYISIFSLKMIVVGRI